MNSQLIDWQQVFRASAALQSVAETSNEGTPSPGSQAAKEMASFANPAVLEEAHAHGGRSLVVACDHAFALHRAIPSLSWRLLRGRALGRYLSWAHCVSGCLIRRLALLIGSLEV